ncbi:MAG: RHS repeat-associated core domain-containing protein [Eubacteriales bacterium]|nr:RHS repeat-associated core domain-containing protein [Eubacteriales bacterium]
MTSGSSTYTYKYDESGIRTQKTLTYSGMIGDSRTYYVTDGSKILYEYQQNYPSYTTTNQKYYYYDDNGYLIGFRYNSVDYYYGRNVQGDIIRIYDSTGTAIVYYSYDAWGNILTITGSLASTVGTANPFRYRGYYYDSETGFYYLNSRYYDPQVGRFINADGIVGANGDIQGYNMFAYCSNNPVMFSDDSGYAQRYTVMSDCGSTSYDQEFKDLYKNITGVDYEAEFEGVITVRKDTYEITELDKIVEEGMMLAFEGFVTTALSAFGTPGIITGLAVSFALTSISAVSDSVPIGVYDRYTISYTTFSYYTIGDHYGYYHTSKYMMHSSTKEVTYLYGSYGLGKTLIYDGWQLHYNPQRCLGESGHYCYECNVPIHGRP